MNNIGKIKQIIGPVVDVSFEKELPAIYDALVIKQGDLELVLETQQHIGDNSVRAIAMGTTDGLSRGQDVVATGAPISVPVGKESLGRIFNVLGETIDNAGPVNSKKKLPIHRNAPAYTEQSTKTEILETLCL